MTAFSFLLWVMALLVLFTLMAAIADFLGWLFPDWLDDDTQAEAEESLEDASPTEGMVI